MSLVFDPGAVSIAHAVEVANCDAAPEDHRRAACVYLLTEARSDVTKLPTEWLAAWEFINSRIEGRDDVPCPSVLMPPEPPQCCTRCVRFSDDDLAELHDAIAAGDEHDGDAHAAQT